MSRRRTYWHLEPLKRKPSDYDIGTSRLLYYVDRGLEVQTPIGQWVRRFQEGSPLRCSEWDAFRDPRETTYARYTELQSRRETFVDGLLESIERTGYDARLPREWLSELAHRLGPLRYPCHGLQMVAAYVGSMAPGGRIAVACAFQTGDEMRRVQRLAYRTAQIRLTHPGFGEDGRARFQDDPQWQPLRRLIEQLLVTYDWGEALVALNVVVKPAFDRLFTVELGRRAKEAGDDVLEQILHSLAEDCAWHRDWTGALLERVTGLDPSMQAVVDGWVARWEPEVARAIEPFGPPGEVDR